MANKSLTERLCRALAVMTIEAEMRLQFMDEEDPTLIHEIQAARDLIAEAGYDFDTIYPPDERPEVLPFRPN